MSDTYSLSGLSRPVKFRDDVYDLTLDELTWAECSRFTAITGKEASAAFNVLFDPRLLMVLLFLRLARGDDQLTWTKFAEDVSPFRDLELVLPDEPAEDPKPKKKGKKGGDDTGEA